MYDIAAYDIAAYDIAAVIIITAFTSCVYIKKHSFLVC